jgi:hypothetical protein
VVEAALVSSAVPTWGARSKSSRRGGLASPSSTAGTVVEYSARVEHAPTWMRAARCSSPRRIEIAVEHLAH